MIKNIKMEEMMFVKHTKDENMRIEEKKYMLPSGEEVIIKSAGPEDSMKVKFHREATSAETHFMARYPR